MKTGRDWTFAPGETASKGKWLKRISGFSLLVLIIDLFIIIAAPVARMYLDIPPMTAFAMFALGIIIGLLLSVECVIVAIIAAFKRNTVALKRSLVVCILGVVPAASILIILGPEKPGSPPIHDISTDTVNPPEFKTARTLRSLDDNTLDYGGETIANQQAAAYPSVQPIFTELPKEQALTKASDLVFQLNWTLASLDNDTGIIEAYDTTRIFGFIDDIVIRVESDGQGSRIDIRSVSRLGVSDLGKNAERITQFIDLYKLSL